MKILVVSNYFPPYTVGGYEVACEGFIRGFTDDRVTVLTTWHGLPGPRIDGDVLRVLPELPVLPSSGVGLPPGLRRFFMPEVFWTAAGWIRRLKPDVCYLWNLRALSIAPLAAARFTSRPVVYHFEDTWLPDVVYHPNPRVENAKRHLAAPLVDGGRTGAIFVSYFLQQLYASRGYAFSRHAVIPNGITLPEPQVRPRAPQNDICRLLFVGRIVPDKGVDVLIEAMHQAATLADRPLELTVAGAGSADYVAELRSRAQGLGVGVNWLGAVSRDELQPIYGAHDVVVVPSSWDEPFGLVAIEAMAAGKPVIASDSGGLTEIVQPGYNGQLVPRRDPADLGRAIAALAGDPGAIERLGRQAARDVCARFDLKTVRTRARQFIESVVLSPPDHCG